MTDGQVETLAWICLGLFALAGIIWLADMIGLVTIRDAGQRKPLNGTLGLTLIGGIASFAATTLFDDDPKRLGPKDSGEPQPIERESPSNGLETPPGLEIGGDDSDAVKPEPPDALPEDIRAFLNEEGLVRPVMAANWEDDYPPCAKRARSRTLSQPLARACFAKLDEFNRRHLLPYQNAYDAYVPGISELSYSQPAGPVLDYLRKEAAEFTRGNAQAAVLFREASDVLDGDYASLRRAAYGSASPPPHPRRHSGGVDVRPGDQQP